MSDRQWCEATYTTPDKAPHSKVGIEFYEPCIAEPALIRYLKGLPEVQGVTDSKGRSKYDKSIGAHLVEITLKPASRTADACRSVMDKAAEWDRKHGCGHGS